MPLAKLVICLALAASTSAVYLQVRHHQLVDYDDYIYILESDILPQGLGVEALLRILREPHDVNWIPLSTLSHVLDYQLYGVEPAGYLLTNVALHIASTLVLFLALARMTGGVWPSAFAAAVFALHPLHVESVAWASERKDALSGLFWMLGLLGWARYAERPSLGRYVQVVLALALGLLSKATLVTLPFALLLLDYWPLRRMVPTREGSPVDLRRLGRLALEKLPLLVLAATFAVVTFMVQRATGAMSTHALLSPGQRVANACLAYVVYLRQTFWPSDLAVFYPHAFGDTPLVPAGSAGVLLGLITWAALARLRRAPWLAIGWLWFLGTLVPMIGLVQVGMQAHADRYMYIPMIGISIAVAWEVQARSQRPAWLRAVTVALATAVLTALALASWQQVKVWRDTPSLFARALQVTEGNYVAHFRLGAFHYREGRLEEAATAYARANALRPKWMEPCLELGQVLAELQRFSEATDAFRQCARRFPSNAEIHTELGLSLISLARMDDAEVSLRRALALGAGMARLHHGLALVAAARGRQAEAIAEERRALSLVGGGELEGQSRQLAGSLPPSATLELDPSLLGAANNLAWFLATTEDPGLRDPDEAVRVSELAVRSVDDPGPGLLDTLAASYAAAGRFDDAVRAASRGAELASARGKEDMSEAIRARLALYRDGRPYREGGPDREVRPGHAESR